MAFGQAPNPPKVPDTVLADRDVAYSNVGGRQTMDIVRPKDASVKPRPAVLLVHGGGFRAGTKEGYIPLAVKLAERGYVAATVTYRLAPGAQFPAPVEDVKAAVRFLRANAAKYNVDTEHIWRAGRQRGRASGADAGADRRGEGVRGQRTESGSIEQRAVRGG